MGSSVKTAWAGCPIRYFSGIFGDKWSLMILRDLMFKGRRYYGEFLTAGEGISTNILADRLQKLATAGVIEKRTDQVKASKQLYTLTEKGLALMPVLLAMIDWSERYDGETEVPPGFANALREDRAGLQTRLEAEIRSLDTELLA